MSSSERSARQWNSPTPPSPASMVRLCLIKPLKFLGPNEPWLLLDASVKLVLPCDVVMYFLAAAKTRVCFSLLFPNTAFETHFTCFLLHKILALCCQLKAAFPDHSLCLCHAACWSYSTVCYGCLSVYWRADICVWTSFRKTYVQAVSHIVFFQNVLLWCVCLCVCVCSHVYVGASRDQRCWISLELQL